jgi:beta-glucuronidase
MLYPVMTPSRSVFDLSGIWKFKLDDGTGFSEECCLYPLRNAMNIPVPSSYNEMKEDTDFRDHCGYAYYQKRFSFPIALCKGQRVVLRCEAVTHFARVFLNGKEIGSHLGGFLPFEIGIGEELREDNLLTIAVDNRIDYHTLPVGNLEDVWGSRGTNKITKKANYPNFDFFNYCGITRPVKILTMPANYIEDITLLSEVGHISEVGTSAVIRYRIDCGGNSGSEEKQSSTAERVEHPCRVEIFDRDDRLAGSAEGLDGEIYLNNVHLWQPLKAYLYRVKVTYGKDIYELPYGVRTVRVEGSRFLINGRAFYFKGYGKHEDTFPHGRGENIPMYVKDISLMKWQGANSFRCSHYPYSEEMMRLADEEGFVVIDETPAVGINLMFGGGANFEGRKRSTYDPENGVQTFRHHRDVIRDLINRDKNYACVVMWNIANEPDGAGEGAYEYFKPLYDLAREIDPQGRPVCISSAQVSGGPDTDISATLSDVICLNRYYGWYEGGPNLDEPAQWLYRELKEWERIDKPLMITEYGADTVAGLHDTTPVMFTEEYQVEFYRMNNRVLDEFPFVVGEHVWNFADFATGQGTGRVQGNRKGLFTRDRRPKLAAHYFRERWHTIPDYDYKLPSSYA